ncbi:hypothetical protein [Paenarthrobacter sp. PH39-S1]|uniref:hypothetical protein n=1 Tax=Paenarthrobacter sp. PH39-S1 TaxID=3046204 RepID=UPI0024BBE841|nr:hypothetical protein [Paenarthrobacter sp. PH39-S1]MDJ0357796.1 hypothetical protein [Paenarthrobacter sp. PH39-S1]
MTIFKEFWDSLEDRDWPRFGSTLADTVPALTFFLVDHDAAALSPHSGPSHTNLRQAANT